MPTLPVQSEDTELINQNSQNTMMYILHLLARSRDISGRFDDFFPSIMVLVKLCTEIFKHGYVWRVQVCPALRLWPIS